MYDAGFVLVVMAVVAFIYCFFLILRRTCKGRDFWGKLTKLAVKKLTPYIFSVAFELVLMELVLAFTLNIVYFGLKDASEYFSLVLMLIVALALLASFFWKIEDDDGQVHYALLYSCEFAYFDNDSSRGKSSGLRALMPLLPKIVVPILLPVFNRRPLLQSSMLVFIFAGKLVCQLSLQHRRRIHLLMEVFVSGMELLAAILLVLLSYASQRTYSEGIGWTICVTLIVLTLITLVQTIINYQLYPMLCRYLYIHTANELCSKEKAEDVE